MNNIITENQNNIFFNDFLDNVAIAIVQQSVEDYRELRREKIEQKTVKSQVVSIAEIEKFFNSKWADALTFGNADYIFNRVKKESEG